MARNKGYTADDYARAYAETGSKRGAAKALGVDHKTAATMLDKIDGGILAAMRAANTRIVPAATWVKTKGSDDKPGYSVLLRPPAPDPVDVAGAFMEALSGLPAAPAAPSPAAVMADLLTLYPVPDAHVGMHAWGRETGAQDYDLALASSDMAQAFADVMALTPASAQAILLVAGDYFHADDKRNETPKSRHKLDVDGRFYKVIAEGVAMIARAVDALLTRHETVHFRAMRGNHDEHSHLFLTIALAQRYQNEPRVIVDTDPRDLFMRQWGRAAIFAHHGDMGKPQQMGMYAADVCPFWSETRHRHFFAGHIHHDSVREFPGIRWETLRAFCPPDAYAAGMGYSPRRALQAITFHRERGIVLRAIEPIERAA